MMRLNMLLPNVKQMRFVFSTLLLVMIAFAMSAGSLYAQLPGKPGTPELVGVTQKALHVQWDPPSNVGAGITGWSVTFCRPGAHNCSVNSSWYSGSQDPVSGPDSNGKYSVMMYNREVNNQFLVRVCAKHGGNCGPNFG